MALLTVFCDTPGEAQDAVPELMQFNQLCTPSKRKDERMLPPLRLWDFGSVAWIKHPGQTLRTVRCDGLRSASSTPYGPPVSPNRQRYD